MKTLLVISHVSVFALGYFILPSSPPDDPKSVATEKQTRPRSRSLPATENPILHASSNDFRNLFREVINSRNPRGPLDNILVAWTRIDPEAALLAFSQYYDPDNSDTVLSGLQNETGPLLAEPLVKHFGKLDFVEPVDIKSAMGRSLGALANEDMGKALSLFEDLPENTPEEIYNPFIDTLEGPQLLDLIDQISLSPAARKMAESDNFWQQAIYRTWRQLSPDQFHQLFQKLDHPDAIKHLTRRSMEEAYRFNDHRSLLKNITSLSPGAQIHAIAAFKEAPQYRNVVTSSSFVQAIEEYNDPDLLERLKRPADE